MLSETSFLRPEMNLVAREMCYPSDGFYWAAVSTTAAAVGPFVSSWAVFAANSSTIVSVLFFILNNEIWI